jgi:hypothetical protein
VRKPFITGNWKLNPQTKAEAVDLARGIAASVSDNSPCDVGLFVPFPFIETVQNIVGDKLVVGAEVSRDVRSNLNCIYNMIMEKIFFLYFGDFAPASDTWYFCVYLSSLCLSLDGDTGDKGSIHRWNIPLHVEKYWGRVGIGRAFGASNY